MSDIDKIEYKKIANVSITNNSSDQDSASTTLLIDNPEDPYSSPITQINGRISYLQELEDLPQGRHLGLFSTIILFISRILGSGIFSIASGIYEDCGGSIFLFFLAWFIAAITAFSGLYIYLELGSLVPRSGGTKVFLEFIYEKPRLLATVAYSIYSIIFGFTLSNILIFGEYSLHAMGFNVTPLRIRIVGLSFLYAAALIHGISVHHGVKVQNLIGALKLGLIVVMLGTGGYVTLFPSSITKIESNLHWDDMFKTRTTVTASKFAGAVIKATFSFGGWNSVHNVTSEIKDPVRTLKIAGPASLGIMSLVYVLINLAYLIVIPGDDIINNGTLVGSLLFEKVYGYRIGRQLLTLSVAICAAGNVFVVIYTISRISQEVFREGYLPFSKFMSSNWPFGAPMPTLILSVLTSTLVILIFPKGDIYNYIVSLEGYPSQVALAFVAFGIFIIRRRYPEIKAPIRASLFGTSLVLLTSVYLIISPLATTVSPNPKGLEYWPSYALLGIACVIFCILFWVIKFSFLPWLFNYTLEPEEFQLEDGLVVKKWIKIYRE
ncbi:very low affinity methionine permease [Scheffersomyces amazonensis]|uniref:very low affinity methionine permease n=1 Tax=Scheffersomyces amazonensis TaxID=1078765 RepID=UPI00315CA947